MPIYNGASTLPKVFRWLEKQNDKALISKLILINDNSTDESLSLIKNYSKSSSYKCIIINNIKNIGLAEGYNLGLSKAKTDLLITMHQDMLLKDKNSFKKIVAPLCTAELIAASYPVLLHPIEVWEKYSFWQKAMFSRFVDKQTPLLSGKFDCFRLSVLRQAGGFDSQTHRTAGEDGDIKKKFEKLGFRTANSGLRVVHLHNLETNFGLKKYIKKENQIAEAQGVLLRRYGSQGLANSLAAFFRTILLIMLLVPYINVLAAVLIAFYSIAYSVKLYRYMVWDIRLLILPLANIYILFSATSYALKGFLTKRQRL